MDKLDWLQQIVNARICIVSIREGQANAAESLRGMAPVDANAAALELQLAIVAHAEAEIALINEGSKP